LKSNTIKDFSIVDLGCDPNKKNSAWGVDHFSYSGVDQVIDLNSDDWNLPSNHFKTIYASHILEHVSSIPQFMRQIHRIGDSNAHVHFFTPHFSSLNSYKDPTHIWHLSSGWYSTFTSSSSYLKSQLPLFDHVKTEVTFGSSFFNFIPKSIIYVKGLEWWEKKFAFIFMRAITIIHGQVLTVNQGAI